MPTDLRFAINQVQAVLYYTDEFSQSKFLATILAHYSSRYDGPMQAIPLPPSAPPELPRLVLTSKDDAFKLQAGPLRIDSTWARTPGSNDQERFGSIEVLDHYLRHSENPPRIGRVALVITRFADHANPAGKLIELFCNKTSADRLFNNSETFEIHNHKVYQLPETGLRINSWMRCKAAEMIKPERKKIVIVEQDINTTEEGAVGQALSADKIGSFFEKARNEADGILHKYFFAGGA
jgi:hypothetical protein